MSVRPCGFILILIASLSAVADETAVAVDAQELFAQARSLTRTGPQYIYDIEHDIDGLLATGTVNPFAQPGSRLTVHTPPRDQWTKEFTEQVVEFERTLEDDIWCQDLIDDIAGYESASVDGKDVTYVVTMAVDEESKEDVKFMQHVVAKLTLSADDGAVLGYSMIAPKPFRPVLVARIKRFNVNIRCERGPDGRTYARDMTTEIEGRALMKSFSEREARKIFDLRAP